MEHASQNSGPRKREESPLNIFWSQQSPIERLVANQSRRNPGEISFGDGWTVSSFNHEFGTLNRNLINLPLTIPLDTWWIEGKDTPPAAYVSVLYLEIQVRFLHGNPPVLSETKWRSSIVEERKKNIIRLWKSLLLCFIPNLLQLLVWGFVDWDEDKKWDIITGSKFEVVFIAITSLISFLFRTQKIGKGKQTTGRNHVHSELDQWERETWGKTLSSEIRGQKL